MIENPLLEIFNTNDLCKIRLFQSLFFKGPLEVLKLRLLTVTLTETVPVYQIG